MHQHVGLRTFFYKQCRCIELYECNNRLLERCVIFQVDQQIERCMICKCSLSFHEFIGDDSEKAWKDECREGNSILLRAKSRYWTLNRQIAKLKDELQESESKRWQTLRTLATIYTHLESKCLRKKVDKLLLFLNISTEKEKQSLTCFEGKKECIEQYEKCKSDLVQDISTQDFEQAKRICFVDMGTRLYRNDKAENAIESSF